jgi:hypothetical protein
MKRIASGAVDALHHAAGAARADDLHVLREALDQRVLGRTAQLDEKFTPGNPRALDRGDLVGHETAEALVLGPRSELVRSRRPRSLRVGV